MKRLFGLWILLLLALTPLFAHEEQGIASWYGGNFQGRKTANGEIFNTNELTAAHKTLPFDTLVVVTNLDNNRQVTVRINDRGPYVGDRIIDLSYQAAMEVDMVKSGTAHVHIETVDPTVQARVFKDPITFTIFVASYGDLDNALRMMKTLTSEGLSPQTELNNQGMTRILFRGVEINDYYPMVKKLESMGIKGIVIRQEI